MELVNIFRIMFSLNFLIMHLLFTVPEYVFISRVCDLLYTFKSTSLKEILEFKASYLRKMMVA